MTDLRYAFRSLLRAPGFTFVAVFTLAIGIGANSAIFSVVNGVVLRPLPYPDAERLIEVLALDRRGGEARASTLDFLDVRAQAGALESLAAYTGRGFTFADGEPELVLGQTVSPDLFRTLRARPALGRVFRPEESEDGRDRVLILGHGLWQRRFGGDPHVVGRKTLVNGRPYEIVGVMPEGFTFPHPRYECYSPLILKGNEEFVNRNIHILRVVGRLRQGADLHQVRAELRTIGDRLARQYPDTNEEMSFDAASLHESVVGPIKPALLLLLASVGLVLLIACANVTNLLLARSMARRRELAIRSALGAARWRLVRQVLAETLLLYAAGGAVGLLLAAWGMDALLAFAPADIPRVHEVAMDGRVLGFTAAISLATAVLFGVFPALQISRSSHVEALKDGGRTVSGGRQRLRTALVIAEVALSVVLLAGAALTVRSLGRLMSVNPGFSPQGATSFSVSLPEQQYPDRAALAGFYERFVRELQGRGLGAAGAITALPLSGQGWSNPMTPEASPRSNDPSPPLVDANGVSPGYFAAMGTPLIMGRDVSWDDRLDRAPVVVVNQALARLFWPDHDAIGRRLKLGSADSSGPWHTVIGVVADVRHESLAQAPRPAVYFPHLQFDAGLMSLVGRGIFVVVRSDRDFATVVSSAKAVLRRLDPQLPMRDIQPMSALVRASAGEPRFRGLLLGLFAAIALALSAIGIYGVLGYLVAQRTPEIAIRLALGASRSEIARVVGLQAGVPVLSGLAIGAAAALWLTRLIRGMLFDVRPTDPLAFAVVVGVLLAAAALATLLPLRAALRVDPMTALKHAS